MNPRQVYKLSVRVSEVFHIYIDVTIFLSFNEISVWTSLKMIMMKILCLQNMFTQYTL